MNLSEISSYLKDVVGIFNSPMTLDDVTSQLEACRKKLADNNTTLEKLGEIKADIVANATKPGLGTAYIETGVLASRKEKKTSLNEQKLPRLEVSLEALKNEEKSILSHISALEQDADRILTLNGEVIISDSVNQELNAAKTRLELVKADIVALEVRIGILKGSLQEEEEEFARLEESINNPESYVDDSRLVDINAQIVSLEEDNNRILNEIQDFEQHPSLLIKLILDSLDVDDIKNALVLVDELALRIEENPFCGIENDELVLKKRELENARKKLVSKTEMSSKPVRVVNYTDLSRQNDILTRSILEESVSNERMLLNKLIDQLEKSNVDKSEMEVEYKKIAEEISEIEAYHDGNDDQRLDVEYKTLLELKRAESRHVRSAAIRSVLAVNYLESHILNCEKSLLSKEKDLEQFDISTGLIELAKIENSTVSYPVDVVQTKRQLALINTELGYVDSLLQLGNKPLAIITLVKELISPNLEKTVDESDLTFKGLEPIVITPLVDELQLSVSSDFVLAETKELEIDDATMIQPIEENSIPFVDKAEELFDLRSVENVSVKPTRARIPKAKLNFKPVEQFHDSAADYDLLDFSDPNLDFGKLRQPVDNKPVFDLSNLKKLTLVEPLELAANIGGRVA